MSGHCESHDQSRSVTATTSEDSSSDGASVQGVEESRSLSVSRDGRKVENGDASNGDAIAEVLEVARVHWLKSGDGRAFRAALLTLLLTLERVK